jgi:hypothetical protein
MLHPHAHPKFPVDLPPGAHRTPPLFRQIGAGEPLRDVPTLVPRVLLFVKQVCVLVEEGLTLAGVRRVFEREAQVAALEASLRANEPAIPTGAAS